MADKKVSTSVGGMVKKARLRLGKSQAELGKMLGIFQSYVNKIENGTQLLPNKRLKPFAKILQLDYEELSQALAQDKVKRVLTSFEITSEEAGAFAAQPLEKKSRHKKSKEVGETTNLFPLLTTICASLKTDASGIVTMSDILFLLQQQKQLPSPMSPELIAELLKNRHSAK